MSPDELMQHYGRRIDCPVPGCLGDWMEHGGEGDPPDRWLHTGAVEELDGGRGWVSREGPGELAYVLEVGLDGVYSAAELGHIAQRIMMLATEVAERALSLAEAGARQ